MRMDAAVCQRAADVWARAPWCDGTEERTEEREFRVGSVLDVMLCEILEGRRGVLGLGVLEGVKTPAFDRQVLETRVETLVCRR